MHLTGTLKEPKFDNSKLQLVLEVNEKRVALDGYDSLKGKDLDITIEKKRNHRSLDANKYFWKLCDSIAKVVGSDKDIIYLKQIKEAGVFVDVSAPKGSEEILLRQFKIVEVLEEYDKTNVFRCHFGSSTYNSKEMSELIDRTVNDAKDLGIDTLTPDEIARMISAMEGNK